MNTFSAFLRPRTISANSFIRPLWKNCAVAGMGAVLSMIAGVASSGAYAQTAHFSGSQVTLPIAGLNNPHQIVVDANGSLYIADTSNNRVVKETLSSGSYTETAIGSGLSSPTGVAVDASGNVYIADSNNGRALKETLSNGSYTQSTVRSNLGFRLNIAVDASGDIFIADPLNSRVLKETPSGNGYVESTIGSNLSTPITLAVDRSGNVYIGDTGSNQVFKETLSGGSYIQTTIVSGLSSVSSVVVDGSNNVYISVYGTAGDAEASQILKETPSNGSYVQSLVGSSSYFDVVPIYIAVDVGGNVFVATSNSLLKVTPSAGDFGMVSVGSSSSPVSLIFTLDTAGTIGAPVVLTQGQTGLDFTDAGTGTCSTFGTTFQHAAGDSCTVDVVLKPGLAGPRYGAAELQSSSGNVIATGYVHGTGLGPQVNFQPGTQSTLSLSNVTNPYALAADTAGDLYIANAVSSNSPQNSVVKETLSNGSFTQSTVATGLAYPVGVAVDGAGNVYIADQDAAEVLEETPASGGGYAQSVAFTNLGNVESVAVDGNGNVYIASPTDGVLKETLTAGAYTQSTIAKAVNASGIAVDEQGNVYLGDTTNNQVLMETLSNGSYTQSTLGSGLNQPHAVSVDGSGNVYIADTGNNQIVKETPSGSSYTQSTVAGGLNHVLGVAVDGIGNVFASSADGSAAWELNFANPPSLSFTTTPANPTSSVQTVTVENIGNAPLSFPIPASGNNPSISANFSLDSTGTTACPLVGASASTAGTLVAGGSCLLPINFVPTTGGTSSGALVLTDNSLNAVAPNYAVQSIALSGTAPPAPVLSFATILGRMYGTAPFTVSATSASSGAVTYAVVSGPATISGSTVTLTGAGDVVLSASQAASGNYGPATAIASFTVAPGVPALSFAEIAPQTYGTAPFTVSATSASSGAVFYTVIDGPATLSGSTVTLTGIGTVVLSATQLATVNYEEITITTSFTVAPIVPALSFAAIPSQTYGTAPFTVSATSASGGAVTYAVVSGPATISGSTVTLTGVGTVVLSANQERIGNYGVASATTSFTVTADVFTLASGSSPASATTTAGGMVSYSLTLTPGAGTKFPNTVAFGVTGLPTGATATFSPVTLPAGSGATTVTLTIQTSNAQTARNENSPLKGSLATMAFALLILPLAGMTSLRKRQLLRLSVMLAIATLSLGAMLSLSGCGGNHGSSSSSPTAQNYALVMTAMDAATGAKSSANLTLTVQ
ncbi:NHL repeat containing protein [Granulicella mallensis]|uniref:NHL repeat containing protein n=1 Tax=Granulicella mallensis (strain ATCC BAA-1857 / DSM 23137 / MP5ACTX8) TaxID=682795 RepID=G8NV22_GRAMM|nr:NHL repeat containing protein [Granulicella mallensis]AEU38792.1 NHL repeat containing protein [Granulicella mallensis MP5ACTX8]